VPVKERSDAVNTPPLALLIGWLGCIHSLLTVRRDYSSHRSWGRRNIVDSTVLRSQTHAFAYRWLVNTVLENPVQTRN